MKKWMFIIMAIIGMAMGTAGCKKAPINSDVEGLWILERFTVTETDETVECERLYYSITRMVTEVAEKDGAKGYGAYIGRTEYRNNETQLVVKDFKVRRFTTDTGQNAPVEMLRHFGINNQQETVFDIVTCDGKKMILKSDYAQLELKKF